MIASVLIDIRNNIFANSLISTTIQDSDMREMSIYKDTNILI